MEKASEIEAIETETQEVSAPEAEASVTKALEIETVTAMKAREIGALEMNSPAIRVTEKTTCEVKPSNTEALLIKAMSTKIAKSSSSSSSSSTLTWTS